MTQLNTDTWRIPRANTLSAQVYEHMKDGKRPKAIAEALNKDVNTIRVLIHRIKHGYKPEPLTVQSDSHFRFQ